jgi:hypothetical protein
MTAPRLAADPALPQRDRLLDPACFGARLAELLGRSQSPPAARVRAKYRVGESLRVLHRVVLDGAPVLVAARGFPAGASGPVFERLASRDAAAPLPVVHDPEWEAICFPFPYDRKLARLELLGDAEWLGRWLELPLTRAELVSWVPEKGAVARGLDARGHARCYVKRYGEGYERALAIQCALARKPIGSRALRLPALVGGEPEQRMVALAAAPGRRIADLRGGARRAALRALGAALATLHELATPLPVERFERLAPRRLRSAAQRIGVVRPDLRVRAHALAAALCASAPLTDRVGPVHGDVHGKNALWDGRAIWLLDLDQLGMGSPALDLGSAVAGFVATAPASRAERDAAELLAGYAAERPLPSGAVLAWHVGAALLVERALRAVHRVRDADLARLPRLLALAERRLAGTRDA